jgi:hypothetical protein
VASVNYCFSPQNRNGFGFLLQLACTVYLGGKFPVRYLFILPKYNLRRWVYTIKV